jgi:hypothetical protein
MKEVKFVEEIGLWMANFGDVNLLYDDIIRDICIRKLWKPQQITDNIILLRNLGIQKIYHFHVEDFYGNSTSNINTTKNFFLYRMLDSEIILTHNSNHIVLAFEENGKTVYKPDKVKYFVYGGTRIYHLYPRDVYHIYHEGVKLLTKNGEIVISKAYSKT